MRPGRFAAVAAGAAAAAVLAVPASAHNLASSTVTFELSEAGMTGHLTLAVGSLDQAFDDGHRSDDMSAPAYATQVIAYLDDHLTVTGGDGSEWPETYSDFQRHTDEGIETIDVDVVFDTSLDTGDGEPAFTIDYDAIIEAVPDHQSVLVLVDAANQASTPGVFTADSPSLTIGRSTNDVAVTDMVRYGFHHVLDGADHLLFLVALLLPAPLVASGRSWQPGPGVGRSIRRVLHVVSAFTIGHSVTLVATASGWIQLPSQPIEILVALSVAVSALHAMRPLARRGEVAIALGFGLVHGMAFAGILTDLGLDGTTSVIALAAFNVGIELAQLAVAAAVFPSLHLISTRPAYRTVRTVGASLTLVAATGWLVERFGLIGNPFEPVELALVEHPWTVAAALAVLAMAIRLADRRTLGSDPTRSALERRQPVRVGSALRAHVDDLAIGIDDQHPTLAVEQVGG